jgi:hypothetical protein
MEKVKQTTSLIETASQVDNPEVITPPMECTPATECDANEQELGLLDERHPHLAMDHTSGFQGKNMNT